MTTKIAFDQKIQKFKDAFSDILDVYVFDVDINHNKLARISAFSNLNFDFHLEHPRASPHKIVITIKNDKLIGVMGTETNDYKDLIIHNLIQNDLVGNIKFINVMFKSSDIPFINELKKISHIRLSVANSTFDDLLSCLPLSCTAINLSINDDLIKVKPIKDNFRLMNIDRSSYELKNIDFLENCQSLLKLKISCSSNENIINTISNLISIKELDLSGGSISFDKLNTLHNLQSLSLNEMKFTGKLNTKLRDLTLYMCDNFDIQNYKVENLTNLVLLEVGAIYLSGINKARKLESVSFHFTGSYQRANEVEITELLNCPNLKNFTSNGGLVKYSESDLIKNLSMEQLSLNDSGIKSIDFLQFYPNLFYFSSNGNKIRDISILGKLKPIHSIEIINADVINIPEKLNKIYLLSENDATESGKQFLNLKNNPLENPPIELLSQGQGALDSYFDSMKGETENLNEAKIIFLGGGEVGKTSLMKTITGEGFDANENATHGINIKPYSVKINNEETVHASIWDFGGQQIMHATHQLFLSRRCVYVLVIEDRKDDLQQDQKIEYWLQQINTFGHGAKILIVKNKHDVFEHNNLKESTLRDKFPNIVFIEPVSCKNKHNIDKFKNALNEQIKNLPMRQIKLSKNWIKIKEEIKALSSEKDHVTLCAFEAICKKNELVDKNAINILRKLLHDLSVIIAFPELEHFDMGILNPHWITDGIYSIINSKILARNNGYIKKENVQQELDSLHPGKYDNKARYIIDAMINFELCHRVGVTLPETYLVPNLLPTEIKDTEIINGDNTIHFIFKYENLLPPSIFTKFLVRVNQDIKINKRWRTGAILADSNFGAQAIVEENSTDKIIKIIVSGEQVRDYFSTIRKKINDLNTEFDINKLGVSEYIPLPSRDANCSEMVAYDDLIGHEAENEPTYFSGKLRKHFNVAELLSGIEPKEATSLSLEALRKNKGLIMNKIDIAISNDAMLNNTVNQEQVQKQKSTQSVEIVIKAELKTFQGTAKNVLEDIVDEAKSELNGDKEIKRIEIECGKVESAVEKLQGIETQEQANENPQLFTRVGDFLQGALDKKNTTGKAIELLGNSYSQVQGLAKKYNKIAGFFGMPTVPDILL